MSLQDMTARELAIQNPKEFLNQYCIEISKIQNIDTEKICKFVKDDLGDSVPSYCYKKYIDKKFKNKRQLENAKKRHENNPATKEQEIKDIETELKKKPKGFVHKLRHLLKNVEMTEVEMDDYLRR